VAREALGARRHLIGRREVMSGAAGPQRPGGPPLCSPRGVAAVTRRDHRRRRAREFGNVSIDTRSLQAGDLYFSGSAASVRRRRSLRPRRSTRRGGIIVPRGWTATGRAPAAAKIVAQPFGAAVVI
jgi:hypothetical protein